MSARNEPWRCSGCGKAAENDIKPCDCTTGVGYRRGQAGKLVHIAFRDLKSFNPEIHVPGTWRCAKCGFILVQSNLNARDGSISARDDAGDRCPNDNAPLWRVSWKEHAEEMSKRCEELVVENVALRAGVGKR